MSLKKSAACRNAPTGNGSGERGKSNINWGLSPRIVQPKRSDFNFDSDETVAVQISDVY
ncbi:MAG: hypothetical protein LH472_06030 [Pyrinomonadaceae bacterium]|nr:hypothetical protein [Pyrinomonadaceae bacterium]